MKKQIEVWHLIIAVCVAAIPAFIGIGIDHQRISTLEEWRVTAEAKTSKLDEWRGDVDRKLERILTILEERERRDKAK